MSNHLAIATVTAALGQLAYRSANDVVAGTDLRFGRPVAQPTGSTERRVHVYLYQVLPHAALRNADLPTRSGSDGRLVARPQAALELRYLVSFYGNDQLLEPDRMMGAVVRDLHVRPLLSTQQIADAIGSQASLSGSDLADGVERVKFTVVGLSLDELSKLWSVLVQTPHALSLVCHASVVLIDALERAAPVLPVLRRGEQDRGVDTQVGTLPQLGDAWVGFLDSAERRPRPPSLRAAQLGARLMVQASPLAADSVVALHLAHPLRPLIDWPVEAAQRLANELTLDLPDDVAAQSDWAAGLYSVVLAVTQGGRTSLSPVWPLLLAPRVTAVLPNPAVRVADVATLDVSCRPQVQPQQAASLRIGELEVQAEPRVAATATLRFVIDPAPAVSAQLVWLRVDGVLSQPVALDPVSGQFVFDDAQRGSIT